MGSLCTRCVGSISGSTATVQPRVSGKWGGEGTGKRGTVGVKFPGWLFPPVPVIQTEI